MMLPYVVRYLIIKEKEQRKLNIEFNTLESISLFASLGSYSFTPRGLQHFSKKINAPPLLVSTFDFGGKKREVLDLKQLPV